MLDLSVFGCSALADLAECAQLPSLKWLTYGCYTYGTEGGNGLFQAGLLHLVSVFEVHDFVPFSSHSWAWGTDQTIRVAQLKCALDN